MADALTAVTDSLLVVSNAEDAGDWIPGAPVARDVRPERGSLVGLHTALHGARRIGEDDVLVVAWDMPFVTAPLLRLIRDRLTPPVLAALPEIGGRLEPFCAAYATACLPAVEAAIASGDLRLSGLVDRLSPVRRMGEGELRGAGDPARLFMNVNSAEDLAAAERLARGD